MEPSSQRLIDDDNEIHKHAVTLRDTDAASQSDQLFSTTCLWTGTTLTVYEPSQWVVGLQNGLARELQIPASTIDVHSPYIGGAFGSKGSVTRVDDYVVRGRRAAS